MGNQSDSYPLPIAPRLLPASTMKMKMVKRGIRRRKYEKEKREGTATKMIEKFKDIMVKEACVNRYDIKEEKKSERFDIFMAAMEKKINFGKEEDRARCEENQA